jgi:hypothetical protein
MKLSGDFKKSRMRIISKLKPILLIDAILKKTYGRRRFLISLALCDHSL